MKPALLDALLSRDELSALSAVRDALQRLGLNPPPLAWLAGCTGASLRIYFRDDLPADALCHISPERDVLVQMCALAGAAAKWAPSTDAIQEHLQTGKPAVGPVDGAWRVLGDASFGPVPDWADRLGYMRPPGTEGLPVLLVDAGGQREEPVPLEVGRLIARLSQDRAVATPGGMLPGGPVALDSLRRALSHAAQEGLEKNPAAATWLECYVPTVAGQLALTADCLRLLAAEEDLTNRARMALSASAANFDAACGLCAAVATTAEAFAEAQARVGVALGTHPDAAHWGHIYELLRQAAYHWRAAAGWLTRSLIMLAEASAE